MICDECGKNLATVHLTKIVNGKKTEAHLCEGCAKKNKEIDFNSTFSFQQFLTGLLDNFNEEPIKLDSISEPKCDKCGMTYEGFRKTGRFGCSHCYESFKDKLSPLFRRIHGHETHTGKIPKRAGSLIRARKEIEILRKQLNTAVEKEEFEKAVEIRDRIKELNDC